MLLKFFLVDGMSVMFFWFKRDQNKVSCYQLRRSARKGYDFDRYLWTKFKSVKYKSVTLMTLLYFLTDYTYFHLADTFTRPQQTSHDNSTLVNLIPSKP